MAIEWMMHDLLYKTTRRLLKLQRHPIRVFCFHKVSDSYQPEYGGAGDWTQTEQFKQNILSLRKRYTFISLEEAYNHLSHDIFRCRNYAVLTSDDGYQCLLNILPWLEEQHIPITLFISARYLDGKSYDPWFDAHWGNTTAEQKSYYLKSMYIHEPQLQLPALCSENISLALHGYGHDDVSKMSTDEFKNYVQISLNEIAYTWGRHSCYTDNVLRKMQIIPVYCEGKDNVVFDGAIHRECIDGMEL